MKKLLIALLFISNLVLAQSEQPAQPEQPEQTFDKALMEIYCVDYASLTKTIDAFGEIPFVRGQSGKQPVGMVPFVMYVNPQEGTWTFVEKIANNKYCIIAFGSNLQPVPKKVTKELEKKEDWIRNTEPDKLRQNKL